MKKICFILISSIITFSGCQTVDKKISEADRQMAEQIKSEFLRSWNAYKTYAWGHDVLLPVSKSHMDWYENSLGISPIDAYSTMKVMGLDEEAALVQRYVTDSLDFDKNQFVKTFEVNIRVLGGLVAMYQFTKDPKVLAKADSTSHIGCCIDSYYEYLLKGSILFNDEDLKKAWEESIVAIQKYVAEETFFLAETMKYLYLTFANPEGINPRECVFSTEAHPFRK